MPNVKESLIEEVYDDIVIEMKNENKKLIILRGIPSSGKSTLAKELAPATQTFSADNFFLDAGGKYNFNPSKLGLAHGACKNNVESAMVNLVSPIVVDNTNTVWKELAPYVSLAKQYGYDVEIKESTRPEWVQTSKLLEDKFKNQAAIDQMAEFFAQESRKTHNVPVDAIKRMLYRWEPTKEIEARL